MPRNRVTNHWKDNQTDLELLFWVAQIESGWQKQRSCQHYVSLTVVIHSFTPQLTLWSTRVVKWNTNQPVKLIVMRIIFKRHSPYLMLDLRISPVVWHISICLRASCPCFKYSHLYSLPNSHLNHMRAVRFTILNSENKS